MPLVPAPAVQIPAACYSRQVPGPPAAAMPNYSGPTAREAVHHTAPPPIRSNRMVSPRQGISPRPGYSWRSRYMEPAGLNPGVPEAARLPPNRVAQGSSTPTMPGPISGSSTPSLSRNNSAQRSFKPVLQKQSRERVWPRGPAAAPSQSARSTSADRRRPRVNPVRRPCRTLSPPEQARCATVPGRSTPGYGNSRPVSPQEHMHGVAPGRSTPGYGNAPHGSFAPPLATPPIGSGLMIGGSGCPHRFRGAALEVPEAPRRAAPPTSAPPIVAPPRVVPPTSADFDTPRSQSNKDVSSSPPSTVPQVLSGTPGSPNHGALPELEGCGASGLSSASGPSGVVMPVSWRAQQPLCLDHNWKFSLDAEPIGAGGAHADFVHVDEDELPNAIQDPRRAYTTAPFSALGASASNDILPSRGSPLMDTSNLMHCASEASVDLSSVSFNLSPIKRSGAGEKQPCNDFTAVAFDFAKGAVCKSCGDGPCRCCSRPPSPLQGLQHPPPVPTLDVAAPRDCVDRENLENEIFTAAHPDSKVAAMRSLWEQRTARDTSQQRGRSSSASAYNVTVGRGRSNSREALGRSSSDLDAQRRRCSLSQTEKVRESCVKRLQREEEATKRYTRGLDDLIKQLAGGGGDVDAEVDSSVADVDSCLSDSAAEDVEGSPATKLCREMSKSNRACWRSQRHLTKVVMKVLAMDTAVQPSASPAPASAAASPIVEKAPLIPSVPLIAPSAYREIAPSLSLAGDIDWRQLLTSAPTEPLPLPQVLPPLSLPDLKVLVTTPPILGDFKSPPTTPQPEEEAEGPLPRKSGVKEQIIPDKSKLLEAEEASLAAKLGGEKEKGSRNSTQSVAEPDHEPKFFGRSPRDPNDELSSSTEQPSLESPGGATSSNSFARPSATGLVTETEPEEMVVTEADSSMNSSGIAEGAGDDDSVEEEAECEISANIDEVVAGNLDEVFEDYSQIRPCEDGMQRVCTMLQAIEQGELKRELYIMVPEGMGADRKVTFSFENKSHEVAVPEGYEVGQQVLITLSNRPFLERTAAQALRRGHPQPDFPDRWSIIDNLRHSLRNDKDTSHLDEPEFRHRYNMYMLLRGRCGAPLLPFTVEEEPDDIAACH